MYLIRKVYFFGGSHTEVHTIRDMVWIRVAGPPERHKEKQKAQPGMVKTYCLVA